MIKSELTSLTVIIPHLNSPEELGNCLSSLADERRRAALDFPVYVVDNGSVQRPQAVCDAFPFVRLLDEVTPGPGPARSHGARMAATDIIAFIDADCAPRSGWIRTILAHFDANPGTAVIGGDVRISHADPERLTAIEAYESIYGYRMQLYYERDHYTGTGNMAVRRKAFKRVGDFAGISVAEDFDWGRRAAALGIRIDFVPEMIIETPARKNFLELARKWDRHIVHHFEEVRSFSGQIRWILKALALGVSPSVELFTILRSDKLSRPWDRWLAFQVLARVRFYRCWRMLSLSAGMGPSSLEVWRKE